MTQDSSTTLTTVPFVADVFSFGAGVNNAIYRILLEESGDNTATFEGTVEYHMLNQLNINSDATYTDLYFLRQTVFVIIKDKVGYPHLMYHLLPIVVSSEEACN
jgi:hypothetical protein